MTEAKRISPTLLRAGQFAEQVSMSNVNLVIFSVKNKAHSMSYFSFSERLHRCKRNAVGQKYFVKKNKTRIYGNVSSFDSLQGLK